MLCAISCSVIERNNTLGDFLYSNYTQFFEEKEIKLLAISNFSSDIETYFDDFSLEGLILSGGNNIGSYPIRDEQEARLIEVAIKRKLPILGICRGMQFINWYFSGRKAPRDIDKGSSDGVGHVNTTHLIKITNSDWALEVGKEIVKVNSFHQQGFTTSQISPELEKMAVSPEDDIVEALRHKEYPIFGVQWHPERKSPERDVNDKLLESFISRTLYWRTR